MPLKSQFHSVSQVADQLCVCSKTVYRLLKTGDLAFHNVGRAVRISEDDLASFIARRRRRGST